MPVLKPDFLVEIPPHRRSEREYVLRVLLGEWLGVAYSTRTLDNLDETRIRLASEPGDVTIAIPDVLLGRATPWLAPPSLPADTLPTVKPPAWTGLEETLPLLFDSATGEDDLVRRDGSRLILRLDLLGSLLFLLAGYEEYVDPRPQDAHGRYPAQASVLGSSGWLQWPILDMYVHVFVALVRLAWPRLRLDPVHGAGLIVSHDVDHPSSAIQWHGWQRLRKASGDLLVRRDLGLALRRASCFLPGASTVSRFDPFNTYAFLMQASETVGTRSTFFFLARDAHLPYGALYDLGDPWAGHLMAEIAARGHHIGLHGSYNSSTDANRLREEWALLEGVCRGLPPGVLRPAVRQHYLRQQPGATWRAQADAGLAEDESLGFADAIGYRAGTARSFPAYDLAHNRQLPLRIRPLHVMDATLLGYMALGDEEALTNVIAMSQRTRRYGGDFSVLWHNSSLETRRLRRLYAEILRAVGALAGRANQRLADPLME